MGMVGDISYGGYTSVYSPDGICLDELANEEGLVYAELMRQELEIRNSFPIKKDRKWKFYSEKYMEI